MCCGNFSPWRPGKPCSKFSTIFSRNCASQTPWVLRPPISITDCHSFHQNDPKHTIKQLLNLLFALFSKSSLTWIWFTVKVAMDANHVAIECRAIFLAQEPRIPSSDRFELMRRIRSQFKLSYKVPMPLYRYAVTPCHLNPESCNVAKKTTHRCRFWPPPPPFPNNDDLKIGPFHFPDPLGSANYIFFDQVLHFGTFPLAETIRVEIHKPRRG